MTTDALPPPPPPKPVIEPGEGLRHRLALRLLPIQECCRTGCRKCNYGRWLKHRPQTWRVLGDEALKRLPPWGWAIVIVLAFALGRVTALL